MTHTHPCEVPNCTGTVECDGYPILHDGGLHCIHDEGPGSWLCEAHEGWRQCAWCGDWTPGETPYCSLYCQHETEGHSLTDADVAEIDADAANKDEKESR